MDEWVVTYRIAFPPRQSAKGYTVEYVEFFRGTEAQCLRVEAAFGGGECDMVPTVWEVCVGPVETWEAFIEKLDEQSSTQAR